MHPSLHTSKRLWSVILAGGEGERVRPLIQRWLGRHRPKQYCTFVGTRSMFQHTLDRAAVLTPVTRMVTVIARGHRREAFSQLDGRQAGTILLQPENRDTASGIFLALTYVKAHDPNARVVIYPSDHFVFPEDWFLETVAAAARATERLHDRVILLGVTADRPEQEYGWILPARVLALEGAHPVRGVSTFVEKPTAAQAEDAMARKALWNTLVLTAKLSTLWEIGRHCFPDVLSRFDRLEAAIGTSEEGQVLKDIYADMPSRNFSRDLLQYAVERVAVMELCDVLWSDWGNPVRIAETIQRIGRTPAFPLECLKSASDPASLAV